jgi:serine protease Do
VSGGGSGFLISSDGYILTNHHVAGNASKIVVTLTDGEKYDAEIIGSDLMSDVCLIKISGKDLPYLKFADSEKIFVGE